jgi:4-amino-4-deoxy-L-arabinose transferase-like glycosyltransferase
MLRQSKQFYFFYGLIVLIYALNIGTNAIWTTHEAYYAESVREMLESGFWSEFFFNYEPRFQKPPLNYWLMASSASLFGLSELSLRLPIIICSLLTILVVYFLGKLLYDEKTGLISMLIFSMSLQFVWFRHYASPEIPLTFFFTLSFYWFYKGAKSGGRTWFYGAFVMLGLAGLTKGFPYLLLFFAIAILADRSLLTKRGSLLIQGLIISLSIGLSWPAFMTLSYGSSYAEILFAETIGRAFGENSNGGFVENLLFYPQVLLWSVFPFS